MSKTQKYIAFSSELIIAIILISIDIKWFLVYALMAILVALDMKTDYLRKLVRVFQIANEIKIITIQRHLKISDKEIEKITKETLDNMTEDQRKILEKDFADISKN